MTITPTTTCSNKLTLGLDLGTTAIKCVVLKQEEPVQILSQSSVPLEDLERNVFSVSCASRKGIQLVATVLIGTRQAIRKLNLTHEHLAGIDRIGICGQMHGIVWWHSATVLEQVETLLLRADDEHERVLQPNSEDSAWSDLITWEDQRCSRDFLQRVQAKIQSRIGDQVTGSLHCSPSATGYGLMTYAHVVENQTIDLSVFDCCGTIMDFVAFVLSGKKQPSDASIDTTNAFSWGCFDLSNCDWNKECVEALSIPLTMLPRVRSSQEVFGTVNCRAFGVPVGADIGMPSGDHPCAVYASLAQLDQQQKQQQQAKASFNVTLVNFGTSAQLAMVFDHQPAVEPCSKSFELRPFFGNRFVGVAASLSGGNMIAAFVSNCQSWRNQLAAGGKWNEYDDQDQSQMYDHLIRLGLAKKDTLVEMEPTFMGERNNPCARASVQHLALDNCSLGDLFAALCKGLVKNLTDMVPPSLRALIRGQTMIGTGNALVRNKLLQHFLQQQLSDASLLVLQSSTDAAYGAALLQACHKVQKLPRLKSGSLS